MKIDMYDFSEYERELLDIGKHPQAEAYFDLAYRAVIEGDLDLAKEYMSKSEEAILQGFAVSVVNGQKPLDEDYDYSKRPNLGIVQ